MGPTDSAESPNGVPYTSPRRGIVAGMESRQQINVKLPPDLIDAARGQVDALGKPLSLTAFVELALRMALYGSAESLEDRVENLDARLSRLESLAGGEL